MRIQTIARAVFIAAALLAGGCKSQLPQFRLNMEGRSPDEVSLSQEEAITQALEQLFGTPDESKLPEGVDLKVELLQLAAGPVASDEKGNQRGLYRQHCAACHGLSGDGAGATAKLLNPYPRDFRNGIFKYTSTLAGAKPARQDLRRTLRRGVPGTAMPSFSALPDHQIEALVEYIKYLSIRGETELYLFRLVVDEDEYLPLGMDAMELVIDEARWFTTLWTEAEQNRVVPPPEPRTDTPELYLASVAKGRQLYAGQHAECVKCHGPEGNGQGEQSELYDDWNKRKRGVSPEQTEELAKLFILPIQRLRPRDFTQGTYRGGSRPIDLYWRIYVGIKGTPMPSAGGALGAKGVYTPEEIRHLVNYVRSLRGVDRGR